jgi:hypothetical protein
MARSACLAGERMGKSAGLMPVNPGELDTRQTRQIQRVVTRQMSAGQHPLKSAGLTPARPGSFDGLSPAKCRGTDTLQTRRSTRVVAHVGPRAESVAEGVGGANK